MRWFQDKDVKHIIACVIQEDKDGWCLVTFNHKTLTPNVYRYHINYLNTFYDEVFY